MEGESNEETRLSSTRFLAKQCYHFMVANIDPFIPTFSHSKAKNIKIPQGQNFKPFERCEFRGLCRPNIQLYKSAIEEICNTNKILKKSDVIPGQLSRRNVKNNKVSNIVFKSNTNESGDSVKTYIEKIINRRPGIRTRRIIEEAVRCYNITRDEQEAKRNILRSRTYIKKDSVSDSDLILRNTSYEEVNTTTSRKQRRTVSVKPAPLPSKEFLDRIRDFNINKRIKECSIRNSLEEDLSSNKMDYIRHEKSRKSISNNMLPLINLPKLKVKQVCRKEKTLCPMSVINIILPQGENLRQETRTLPRKKPGKGVFPMPNKNSNEEDDFEDILKEKLNGRMRIDQIKPQVSMEQFYKNKRSKGGIGEKSNEIRREILNEDTVRRSEEETSPRETFYHSGYRRNKDLLKGRSMYLLENCRQHHTTSINQSNDNEIKLLNETLSKANNLMHRSQIILDSLKGSNKKNQGTGRFGSLREKFPLISNTVLPNRIKPFYSSLEECE